MPPTTATGPGARLRAAREAAGVSRRDLARRLDVAYPTLADIEADRKPISLDKIHEVAVAIGIDPHSIDERLASREPTRRPMATEVKPQANDAGSPSQEPEILPLSLVGKWVAWSSDGMRIVASAVTSEEAERLAIAAGEPEPILQPHPGRYRL